jgi:hypothetical protein
MKKRLDTLETAQAQTPQPLPPPNSTTNEPSDSLSP